MANLVETPPPAARAAAHPLTAAPAVSPFVKYPTLALFLISSLGLFLELLLIRWISTEIRIFAYLQNTVLVVCFLGLGMGCWDSRRGFHLRDLLMPLTILVALLAIPPTRSALGEISTMLGGFQDFLIWSPTISDGWMRYGGPIFGLVLTAALMVLLWEIFVPVGRLLGRLLDEHPHTVKAYSVNVAGSLVGIWLFVLASAFYLPPAAWFAAFAVLACFFLGVNSKERTRDMALLGLIVVLASVAGFDPLYAETRWTPYQKLSLRNETQADRSDTPQFVRRLMGERGGFTSGEGQGFIAVNNTGYQAMFDLRRETVAADPKKFPPAQSGWSQYDVPTRLHPEHKSVLVVGAGSGNDAAGALRNGAGRVVAVEIDPGIIEIGRRLHPEKPYDDPRCVVVNDDARSYFATCNETFDVITFGLLDSHTTTAMTNARLDHYVYTVESLTHARKLLKPGGVMVLSFEAQKAFVADRMGTALTQVFGHAPLVFRIPQNGYGWGGLVFVTGESDALVNERVGANPELKSLIAGWQKENPTDLPGLTPLATDDWPYIYLERPSVPVLYFLLAGVLVLLFARGVWRLGAAATVKNWSVSNAHFFFLGAAFMLLEVQNISKASVVLGNTWSVNAVVISGVMTMILLANLIAAKLPRLPQIPVYSLLIGSCIGLYFVDLSRFAFLPYATKAVVVGLLTSLPMLFSGVVFVRSFAATDRKDSALAANLMGALAGGLLQSITFVTGIKALLLIVTAFYLAAVLLRPKPTAPVAKSEPSLV
ncbi:MAG TPA: methyltransferase domain-containing protein [Urbifossiella sp.]|nr:methyltransferase domain-containing protein [Urbifossiella sp.]